MFESFYIDPTDTVIPPLGRPILRISESRQMTCEKKKKIMERGTVVATFENLLIRVIVT